MNLSDVPTRVRNRFWARVEIRSDGECWPWLLSTGSHGYGQIGWWDENKHSVMALAHRVAYVLTHGEIPCDLTVDHTCRNRICCNPGHLRLVPNEENARLNGFAVRDRCGRGHPYTAKTLYVSPRGHRFCRVCRALTRKDR